MNEKEIEDYVNSVLKQMSLEEKVDQMVGNGLFIKVVEDRGFGKRVYDATGSKKFNIPPFKFTDGPRGVIIPGSTCFPVSMARGASWDIDLEQCIGDVIGEEVRAHGGNLFGGVCINLLRHPAWGRAQETYGEDPFLIGEFGAALTRGVQKHNVMATAKHFVANSIENARFKVNVKIDERTLREVYLPHFKRCVEEGCATIMSAYNKLRGKYCGHNDYLLRDILKGDWKFQGFVHSDWMYGVKNTVGGITGGLDVEMPRAKYYKYRKIKRALEWGNISQAMIDEAAGRVMRTILKYNTKKDSQTYGQDLIGCEEHRKIALEAAEKSMVLLKNEKNILPLDKNKINKIAIFGKYAKVKNTGDHGSSNVRIKKVITPLEGIKEYLGDSIEVLHNNGYNNSAIKLAKKADVSLIVVGLNHKDEGEYIKELRVGGDRDFLSLHRKDIELIKAVSAENEKAIVVLIGGSAITMEEWKAEVPAILMAWYSGVEGGTALAKILFGDVNPSGKLPFTIPKDPKNLPFFDKNADEIEYGYYHGYTFFDKEGYVPAFAFGHGLSYTKFNYSNLQFEIKEDKVIATVDVKNDGKKAGGEVVQLYIGFEQSQIERPIKLLKGFSRVSLEPNEIKKVKIEVSKKNLAWYNPKTKSWEIEKIEYTLYIGGSSKAEDLLSTQFNLNI
ncbi:MAG: glycoside hydrolase family 3 C-terminal domain-containing protein [Promethearchaeota archaeon]|nr:MAG: glycoside hydrolase family 3 C-terminal domain-containing protein [Candidatus Lokiarchaeota archaeon]